MSLFIAVVDTDIAEYKSNKSNQVKEVISETLQISRTFLERFRCPIAPKVS